ANVGGAGYVTEIWTFVPSAAAAEYYFDILKRKHLRRVIIATATDLIRASFEELDQDEQDLLDDAQRRITTLSLAATEVASFRSVRTGISPLVNAMEKIFHRRGHDAVLGYETGFLDIDRMTGGIQNQEYYIIGARPSQGKTAVAVNIASHMAVKNNIP